MHARIEKLVEDMSNEDKATLAGEILAEVDPTKTNLEAFFRALKSGDENTFAELLSRAASADQE